MQLKAYWLKTVVQKCTPLPENITKRTHVFSFDRPSDYQQQDIPQSLIHWNWQVSKLEFNEQKPEEFSIPDGDGSGQKSPK